MNFEKFRISFLFFASCILFLDARAQKVTYSSEPIDNYNYDYLRIIGYDDNGFYLLQSNLPLDEERDRVGFKSRKYKVSYYTANLSEKWSKPFDKGEEANKIETVGIINGSLLTARSAFKDNENKLIVSVTRYDQKGNENGKPIVAGEISFEPKSELDKLKFVSSVHHNCFGLIQVEKKDNKTQTLNCIVIDTGFTVLHTLRFDIPYSEKNFYFTNWLLSDAGDFALLGYLDSKQNSADKKRWDAYKLFVARAGFSKAKEYSINTSDVIFSGGEIACDASNNKLVLAGFYDEKFSNKAGIVYANLSLDKEDTLHLKKQTLADGHIAKILNTKTNDYKSIDLTNFVIEKIVVRNDGSIVLVAEASFTSDYSYYDYFTQSYIRQTEYHFENVIALSIAANGSVEWDAILRKDQASINDDGRFSSFCFMQTDEKINLFYNTTIERNNKVAVFSVSNTGESSEKDFINADDRILLIPYAARQISADELIVPCWSKRKLLLSKITF